jgi:hypothetical protein
MNAPWKYERNEIIKAVSREMDRADLNYGGELDGQCPLTLALVLLYETSNCEATRRGRTSAILHACDLITKEIEAEWEL